MWRECCAGLVAVAIWGVPSNSIAAQDIPIPEYYGIYIISGGTALPPRDAVKEDRLGVVGNLFYGHIGLKTVSGTVAKPDVFVLVYGKDVSRVLNALKLGRFKYAERVRIRGYFGQPDEWHDGNMWIWEDDVPLRVGPVKGREALYRVVPASALAGGVYGVYIGELGRKGNPVMMLQEVTLLADFQVGTLGSTKSRSIVGGDRVATARSGASKKVSVGELTRNVPDSQYFLVESRRIDAPFEIVWASTWKYMARYEMERSDEAMGIMVAKQGTGIPATKRVFLTMERVSGQSVHLTVQAFCYSHGAGRGSRLPPEACTRVVLRGIEREVTETVGRRR
jgi:hypothetical protein